jgi:hypothetical protein
MKKLTKRWFDQAVQEHGSMLPVFVRGPVPMSRDRYVQVCRRIDPSLRGVDGRLIAAGWCKFSPLVWASEVLPGFLGFWNDTQIRPNIVGSYYNADVETAYVVWRHGWWPKRAHPREWDLAVVACRHGKGLRVNWRRYFMIKSLPLDAQPHMHGRNIRDIRGLSKMDPQVLLHAIRSGLIDQGRIDWNDIRGSEVSYVMER